MNLIALPAHAELVERLRSRIRTLEALADLREHDLTELWDRSDRFLAGLLDLLNRGRVAEARARISWSLSREPGEASQ